VEDTPSGRLNANQTQVPSIPARRARAAKAVALKAEIAALTLENRKLQDAMQNPDLRDYAEFWSATGKRLGLTADQTIGAMVAHMDVDQFRDSIMPPEMHEAYIEHIEGCARARVAERSADDLCPCGAFEMDGYVLHSSLCKHGGNVGNVIAFRLRKPRS
jgi:hypothetical protein